MFQLSTVQDTFRVAPGLFARPVEDVLREEIDAKYARRVILEVGFCLCACAIVELGDGMVHPLDGCATYVVTFQVLVFRPFAGEILEGTIRGSNGDGLVVSVDFFDNIVVPPKYLPEPSVYDEQTRIWTWKFNDDDFPLDVGLSVYLRVRATNFTRISAHKLGLQATTTTSGNGKPDKNKGRPRASSVDLDASTTRPVAMTIIADIKSHGLGPLSWWADDDDEDDAHLEEDNS